MPVRRYMVTLLTEKFTGVHWWNNLVGECQSMPTAEYRKARDAADQGYEWFVQNVDWWRIVLEASARHAALTEAGTHEHPEGARILEADETCPRCIRDALLVDNHNRAPGVPPAPSIRATFDDWPGALAESVQYRQKTHTENGATT